MDKQSIRLQVLQQRQCMDHQQRVHYSHTISQTVIRILTDIPLSRIHCYRAIEAKNEPETKDIIDYVVQKSKVKIDTFVQLDNWKNIRIPEGNVSSSLKYDVIIVPTLGFDTQCNRIGYGGGFYDRFLAEQSQALKIGLCFEYGKVATIRTEPHDIPLDIIITERKIYKRKR
jgi:5-formyltetrahydrofolate cyclo-ligase